MVSLQEIVLHKIVSGFAKETDLFIPDPLIITVVKFLNIITLQIFYINQHKDQDHKIIHDCIWLTKYNKTKHELTPKAWNKTQLGLNKRNVANRKEDNYLAFKILDIKQQIQMLSNINIDQLLLVQITGLKYPKSMKIYTNDNVEYISTKNIHGQNSWDSQHSFSQRNLYVYELPHVLDLNNYELIMMMNVISEHGSGSAGDYKRIDIPLFTTVSILSDDSQIMDILDQHILSRCKLNTEDESDKIESFFTINKPNVRYGEHYFIKNMRYRKYDSTKLLVQMYIIRWTEQNFVKYYQRLVPWPCPWC